jgi:Protein of unknown function (DUF3102)
MNAPPNLKTAAPPTTPTPEQLAEQIGQEYTAILSEEQTGNHKIVERAIRVGDKLIYCKGQVAHGNWEQWVKTFCPALSKSTVERWMNLAKNKDKIDAEIKDRISKNSTVTFLTLRQALAIANPQANPKGGNGETNASNLYDKASDNVVAKLKALAVDEADAAATKTSKALKETVATMKAGAKNT